MYSHAACSKNSNPVRSCRYHSLNSDDIIFITYNDDNSNPLNLMMIVVICACVYACRSLLQPVFHIPQSSVTKPLGQETSELSISLWGKKHQPRIPRNFYAVSIKLILRRTGFKSSWITNKKPQICHMHCLVPIYIVI